MQPIKPPLRTGIERRSNRPTAGSACTKLTAKRATPTWTITLTTLRYYVWLVKADKSEIASGARTFVSIGVNLSLGTFLNPIVSGSLPKSVSDSIEQEVPLTTLTHSAGP